MPSVKRCKLSNRAVLVLMQRHVPYRIVEVADMASTPKVDDVVYVLDRLVQRDVVRKDWSSCLGEWLYRRVD